MDTADVSTLNGRQNILLPTGFQVPGKQAAVRKVGDAIVVEPLKPSEWPEGFFEAIHIDDSSFERPPQGSAPPISLNGAEPR